MANLNTICEGSGGGIYQDPARDMMILDWKDVMLKLTEAEFDAFAQMVSHAHRKTSKTTRGNIMQINR